MLSTISQQPDAREFSMTEPGTTSDGDTDAPVDEAHPGAGGLKSRIHRFLFGGTQQRVDRFTIQRSLGSGGMGTVYLAQDDELGRLVALKLVRYDRVSTRMQARLRREAQALAKLAHPNVVSVFEVGEHEGLLFVAMEYVEGVSLRAWLDAGPRSWQTIVEVFEQAAAGLAAAHEAGLIHRDFKPENVIVGADGRVRVVDFGIVATEHDAGELAALAEDEHRSPSELALTQTGELIGTPAYMAPEQFLGETPTPASDQFAFFVALYEALSKQRPFAGTGVHDTMRAVLAGESRALRGISLPARLRATITRGIARQPSERFPDMATVLVRLREARLGGRGRLRMQWAAGSLAMMGLGVMVLLAEPQTEPASDVAVVANAPVDPDANEQAKLALAALLELDERDDEQRVQLAESYLAAHAEDGGVARRVIAEVVIAASAWRGSCAAALDGLCIRISAPEPGHERCEEADVIDRVERSEAEAERARERLELVLDLAATASSPSDARERAALADAIGQARTLLADAELESYLGIRAPRGLDFIEAGEHAELSKDAFAGFFEHKLEVGERVADAYAEVKQAGSDRWTLQAATRSALIYQHLADALLMLPIESDLREPAQREAYCTALAETTKQMREQAAQALEYCKAKASELGLATASCELPTK